MCASRANPQPLATDADAIVGPYGPDDMAFCWSEFDRLFLDDAELRSLCERLAGSFMPDGKAALPAIVELVEDRLFSRQPLSMQRVGNGEGNAVSLAQDKPTSTQARALYHEFISQNGIAVPLPEVIALCGDVKTALVSADVVGVRNFPKFRTDERTLVLEAIERQDAYAALGLIYARHFLREGLETGFLRGKTITSAWLHLDLLAALERLLQFASSVVVVTAGRSSKNSFARDWAHA